ncbi:MAG: hypothetical protein LBC80_10650 [Treponema sp.]|nr:hypothetical protein [Treponema sp.]
MKNRIPLVVFLFVIIITQVHAFGKKDETQGRTLNNEWIFCITNFDVSSLPPDKTNIAGLFKRELVDNLKTIQYRFRTSSEFAFYEEVAWTQARSTAAKAIAARMDERSRLIFQGDPNWRFRRNIERIDNQLVTLWANLEEIEKNAPLINEQPIFNLTRGNRDLVFPPAPAPGSELRFCTTQNADAFLTGVITDFHGRYFLSVRLFTVFTRSFIWEDSVIFSLNDIDIAIEELTQRLILFLSGSEPATVILVAEPHDTLLLINQNFAGRGSTDAIEFQPQTITVTASAPDHESITFEAELFENELTLINLSLTPVRFVDIEISGDYDGRVYQGSLFVGITPLTLPLLVDQFEYIELEIDGSRRGDIVFRTPYLSDMSSTVSVKTKVPLPKGSVEKQRNLFYWAWGITWITGIVAWISRYSFIEASNAFHYRPTQNLYNKMEFNRMVSSGAVIALSAAGVYTIYRAVRFIGTANSYSTPITVPSKNGRD